MKHFTSIKFNFYSLYKRASSFYWNLSDIWIKIIKFCLNHPNAAVKEHRFLRGWVRLELESEVVYRWCSIWSVHFILSLSCIYDCITLKRAGFLFAFVLWKLTACSITNMVIHYQIANIYDTHKISVFSSAYSMWFTTMHLISHKFLWQRLPWLTLAIQKRCTWNTWSIFSLYSWNRLYEMLALIPSFFRYHVWGF